MKSNTANPATLTATILDENGAPYVTLAWVALACLPLLAVIAIVIAFVLKTFLAQAFYIPSESMEPGLVRNDRILVEKVSYWFGGSPERGDVVVFKDPGDWLPPEDAAGPTGTVAKVMERIGLYPSGGHLVKRVIGVVEEFRQNGELSLPANYLFYRMRLDGPDPKAALPDRLFVRLAPGTTAAFEEPLVKRAMAVAGKLRQGPIPQ